MFKVALIELKSGLTFTALTTVSNNEVVRHLHNAWKWKGVKRIKYNGKSYAPKLTEGKDYE